MRNLTIIVLAAGKGTRMKSRIPKVLHTLAGKPLLGHVLDTARSLNPNQLIVVTGHESERVRAAFKSDLDIEWVEQTEQNGTGHAVQTAMPLIRGDRTLVLYGDVPLTKPSSLESLMESQAEDACAVLTMMKTNPTGYGRIIRTESLDKLEAIVEQKDASADQLLIKEVNTGVMALNTERMMFSLRQLSTDNAQGELYLTDVVEILVAHGEAVNAHILSDESEAEGVNSRSQLASLERIHQRSLAEQLMDQGNTLADPNRMDIRGSLVTGQDNFIDINCVFEGSVTLGDDVAIGPNCVLKDCSVQSGTRIHANSMIDSAVVGESCDIGPYARIRPGSTLDKKAKLGNFVELKKAHIGEGSKVNHLSYIGDCEMGKSVNVGAGTITCNYDGANKHQTIIGNGVFIGSNTALVAPIRLGDNATIGAGTTLSSEAPADALTYSRAPAKTSKAWKRPIKKQR